MKLLERTEERNNSPTWCTAKNGKKGAVSVTHLVVIVTYYTEVTPTEESSLEI